MVAIIHLDCDAVEIGKPWHADLLGIRKLLDRPFHCTPAPDHLRKATECTRSGDDGTPPSHAEMAWTRLLNPLNPQSRSAFEKEIAPLSRSQQIEPPLV